MRYRGISTAFSVRKSKFITKEAHTMCEICHMAKCPAECPNAEPEQMFTCDLVLTSECDRLIKISIHAPRGGSDLKAN